MEGMRPQEENKASQAGRSPGRIWLLASERYTHTHMYLQGNGVVGVRRRGGGQEGERMYMPEGNCRSFTVSSWR